MKKTATVLVFLLAALFTSAQRKNVSETRNLAVGVVSYIVKLDITLPNGTERLDSILGQKMFGGEGTVQKLGKKYLNRFNAGQDCKKTVSIYARQKSYNEKTGMVSVAYVVPGENSFATISEERYLTFDLNKGKVVMLSDLVTPQMQSYLSSKGINASTLDNIETDYWSFTARNYTTAIKMDPEKLYKNMSDYGLSLVGMDRSAIENKVAVAAQESAGQKSEPDSVRAAVFDVVETNAQYPGGEEECIKFLSTHIKYPRVAQEKNIQGRVLTQFFVDKDGTITDVEAIRSPHELLSKEAIRVVKLMPKWIPATLGSKPVRSRFVMPVMFRIGEGIKSDKPNTSK